MSILGDVLGAISSIVGVVLKPVSWLLQSLVPELPKPDQGRADQVYSISTSNEFPRAGDPVPLLFGEPVFFPPLLSLWAEYLNNQQITHVVLTICHGPCQVLEVTNNGTPFNAAGSIQLQTAQPGEATTLAAVYVYVNQNARDVELLGSALDLEPYSVNATFGASGAVTVNSGASPFGASVAGDRFTVTGTTNNDVEFIIDTVTDATHITAHRADSGAITAETSDCTINLYTVNIGGATGWARSAVELVEGQDDGNIEDIVLSFDATQSTVQLPGADYWGDLSVGDIIQATRGANAGVDFDLLAISGAYGVLSPAPVTESSVSSALVRVRRRFGPYELCAPGQVIDGFNVNIVAGAGIYKTNDDGELRTASVGFEMQIERIDDSGNSLGPITSLGERRMSGRDRTPQRATFPIRGMTPGRYQLYIARVTPSKDDAGRSDAISLDSVVGFVVPTGIDPALSDATTRLAMTIRSTSALTGDLKVRVRARGMHPLWDGTAWTDPQPTNDIAPAWSAILRAHGKTVDTDVWESAHAAWQAAGWEYHGYISGSITLGGMLEDILRCGDARRWYDWRTNRHSMWRERQQSSPVLMLHDGNVDQDSINAMDFGAVPEDAPTGYWVQYTDPRTGENREVLVGSDERAQQLSLAGVQSRQQAFELGHRELMRQHYRRQTLDGRVLWIQRRASFGAQVLVQSYQHRMGQAAWLESVSGSTLVVDREIQWHTTEQHRAWIVDRDGVPMGPVYCSRGSSDRHVVVSGSSLVVHLGDDGGDPSMVIIGYPGHEPRSALIAGVGEGDEDYIATVTTVLDAPEVYSDPGAAPADEYPTVGDPPDLTITNFVLLASGATTAGIQLTGTWTKPPESVSCVVEYRLQSSASWTQLPPVLGGIMTFTASYGGTYEARVYALGPYGTVGPASNIATVVVTAPAMSVSVSPSSQVVRGSASQLLSEQLVGSVSGGVAPFTYAWVKVSGSVGVSANSPTAKDTTVTAEMPVAGTIKVAVFRLDVTDAASTVASSNAVSLSFERTGDSGPIP